ncbi:ribbon-helix-helix protein, CopG family [Epibacterium sp. SM1979]|uniref:Ribbon-helix-helix protein, CopG family n=1 Tax=Tritonibacter litoralis TaxID=2662264 RepID=A0A843YCT8_9RHOB|nr:ribbon-helix-helix protein, CopG family [Tritonibacter litoralis]MQQ08826.1 ribbon-helix-helix protein, CopG family [Tritonibacter litoralis]
MAKDKQNKSSEGDKKNTSLRLERKTLKALKIRAIEEDTSVQKIIEQLIEEYLAGTKKKN